MRFVQRFKAAFDQRFGVEQRHPAPDEIAVDRPDRAAFDRHIVRGTDVRLIQFNQKHLFPILQFVGRVRRLFQNGESLRLAFVARLHFFLLHFDFARFRDRQLPFADAFQRNQQAFLLVRFDGFALVFVRQQNVRRSDVFAQKDGAVFFRRIEIGHALHDDFSVPALEMRVVQFARQRQFFDFRAEFVVRQIVEFAHADFFQRIVKRAFAVGHVARRFRQNVADLRFFRAHHRVGQTAQHGIVFGSDGEMRRFHHLHGKQSVVLFQILRRANAQRVQIRRQRAFAVGKRFVRGDFIQQNADLRFFGDFGKRLALFQIILFFQRQAAQRALVVETPVNVRQRFRRQKRSRRFRRRFGQHTFVRLFQKIAFHFFGDAFRVIGKNVLVFRISAGLRGFLRIHLRNGFGALLLRHQRVAENVSLAVRILDHARQIAVRIAHERKIRHAAQSRADAVRRSQFGDVAYAVNAQSVKQTAFGNRKVIFPVFQAFQHGGRLFVLGAAALFALFVRNRA